MHDEQRRLKIGFLTSMDPKDKRAWSGTLYYAQQALQKYCGEIFYIVPTNSQKPGRQTLFKMLRVFVKKNFSFTPLFSIGRKYFVCHYRIFTAKKFAKAATKNLEGISLDVIVAAASTTEIAFVETDIPIVLIEDATFWALHDYYPQYSNLPKGAVREMNALADIAIKKASLLFYPSPWAARSAIEDYAADQHKVHIIPMGANMDNPPSQEIIQKKKKSGVCRLFFIGFDWHRKGGDIAFETLLKLEEMGIQAELIVCGCVPPKKCSHRSMKVIPYLDKNDTTQYRELEQLYLTSDFLLLPTRNECFGIVFCEANAYGLPAISTRTGGIADVIKDGENGYLLPFTARGDAYAKVIAEIYQDDQRYAALVRSSRAAFDDRLNWDSWGIAISKHITELLEHVKTCTEVNTTLQELQNK